MKYFIRNLVLPVYFSVIANCLGCAQSAHDWSPIMPEQRAIEVREPADLLQAQIPETNPPPTISNPQIDAPEYQLSLDEAIRIALENSEVVRVLTGVAAASSGSTIYDPAIANTVVDQERGRFDPSVDLDNTFSRREVPQAIFDPFPFDSSINGTRTDGYNMDLGVSKTTIIGGSANLGVNTNPQRFQPGVFPLNPQARSSVELSYVQRLLKGGGIGPNNAPIVLARIDAERSYFRYKDSVQELVRGVIEAYWALVFSRADVWSRRQQVEQSDAINDREEARLKRGFGELADVAQSRLSLASFRSTLIGAEANLLQREAALRNIMGLPPTGHRKLIPTTPPLFDRLNFDWQELLRVAQERRPDLVELKLIIEADEQLLLQARNQALPAIDAVMLYRWNGLEGQTPSGARISSGSDQFTDWTLGVNFSVPLGLRQSRASLRRQELVIARDRANLQQGVHSMVHTLAANIRNLDQFYEQYEALKETRIAARDNLRQQLAEKRAGNFIFLNVIQAITSWGNAVSAEAQLLILYNTELANIERQTGTILETHGVRFYEERYRSIGPLHVFHSDEYYPESIYPGPNSERFPGGSKPSENAFDLSNPIDTEKDSKPRNLRDRPPLPPLPAPEAKPDESPRE